MLLPIMMILTILGVQIETDDYDFLQVMTTLSIALVLQLRNIRACSDTYHGAPTSLSASDAFTMLMFIDLGISV
jgi:hypothetical protein